AIDTLPVSLDHYQLVLTKDGAEIVYTYDSHGQRTGITHLLTDLADAGIRFKDLDTSQSSLEDIFVNLVRRET
ncbi:MAG: multidrug ABC transporter ATP-binding protein, partial [Pseudomonadota bacterium]